MRTELKTFASLQTNELYALLQLRAEVFVVEQDCVYQDLDGKDVKAWHLLGYNGETLVAYTRIFAPGDYFNYASIGRVVVHPQHRSNAYGKAIMRASITAVANLFGTNETICISAQYYLLRFYNELGFIQEGEIYLEDGIPHIKMLLKPGL